MLHNTAPPLATILINEVLWKPQDSSKPKKIILKSTHTIYWWKQELCGEATFILHCVLTQPWSHITVWTKSTYLPMVRYGSKHVNLSLIHKKTSANKFTELWTVWAVALFCMKCLWAFFTFHPMFVRAPTTNLIHNLEFNALSQNLELLLPQH